MATEILTKTIKQRIDRVCIHVQIPQQYVDHLQLQPGDKVNIKASPLGEFLLQKTNEAYGLRLRKNNAMTLPKIFREKYRITEKHKVMFYLHNDKVLFRFTKEI